MSPERTLADPEDRYPSQGMREAEEHALRVLEVLPSARLERTRDVIQLTWHDTRHDQEGLVVVVTAEALEIRLPTVEWTESAYGPAASSCLWRRHLWRDLEEKELPMLIRKGIQARRKQFATCQHCGERVAKEHRFDAHTCHGCASTHQGIVY